MRIHSLQTRLTILILAITVPLLAAVMVFVTDRAGRQIEQDANERLRASQTALKLTTEVWLDLNIKALKQLVSQPEIVSMDPVRQKPVLKAMAAAYPHMYLISTTDLKGINVARNDDAGLTNYSDRGWFQKARDGASLTFQILIGRTTNKPALVVSTPIKDSSGQIVGVGMFASELTQVTESVQAIRIGQTGFAYIVSADNLLVAHPNPDVLLKNNQLVDASKEFLPVKEFRQGRAAKEEILSIADENGVRWRYTVDETKDYGWVIVVQQQEAELFSRLRLFQQVAWGALVVGVGLLVVMAWFTFRQTFQPIRSLTETVTAITAGDLTRTALVTREDEIGVLAHAFNQMTAQLRDLIGSLETRVEARTAQLSASAEVARAASSILNPHELLQATVDLIRERFGHYYAGVFLVDEEGRSAVLRAGTGEAGQTMLSRGHKFEVGSQSMVGWVCANRQARIALDVGQDAVRFANPLLPDTRSEIALPLQAGGRILGVLDVQSERQAAFDENDIAVLQGMADQIAVALENARLFTQTQATLSENERLLSQVETALQEATALHEAGQAISTASDTAGIFQAIVEHGLKPEIDLCLLVLFEEYETPPPNYVQVSQMWIRSDAPTTETASKLRAGLRFEFTGFPLQSWLTFDPVSVIQKRESEHQAIWQHLPSDVNAVAVVPLIVGARWIGALTLGAADESALSPDALKPYQSMANQAAVAIENRRLVETTQANLQQLSALYRTVTRDAWKKTLETRPQLAEYDYASASHTNDGGAKLEVPLTLHGQEIGVLELASENRATWTEQERMLVEAIATQTALALDSARLFDETQRLAGRERLINEITARIRAATGVSGILQTAARELAQAIDVPHAVARIHLKDES